MNAPRPDECARRLAEIKRGWTDTLQVEPGWQYVESNPVLLRLMDQVLEELERVLASPSISRWLDRTDPILLPEWNPSLCGLALLVPFLAAGKAALRRVLEARGAGDGAREVLLAFDAVAQREIERVCRPCRISIDCPFAGRSPGRN